MSLVIVVAFVVVVRYLPSNLTVGEWEIGNKNDVF
jgi:hypothetical protein